ncbi:ribonuclease H-like domain-containing protein, partial [Tanacetum coccineum]
SLPKTGNSAFAARPNNRNNNWNNNNNNQARKLNRPNLVCTHCNMNGHTADRCFDLVGYPPNFKKSSFNKNSGSSNVVSGNKDKSTSNSFIDDQFKKLMALISDKSGSSSMPANIAGASQHMTYTILNMFNVVEVSKLNMIVGHPNGTKAIVTHVGSLRLTDQIVIHDVLVVPGYEDSVQRTQVGTGNESNGLYFLEYRLPSSLLSGKLPYELVFCSEPNLSHLKTFGCLYFSTVLNDFEKFSSRSDKSMFIGYSNDKKGYKLNSLESKKVFYSRDVKFYETVFPFKNSTECKEYEMVFQNKNSLNFFNNDEDESKSEDPYDDRRDKEPKISEGIDH